MRLVKGWEIDADIVQPDYNKFIISWMEERFNEVVSELDGYYEQYKLSEALMSLYNFVWNDFFSWYLEVIKPGYEKPIDKKTLESTIDFFERILTVMHPFMPFISEEVWHYLREKKAGDDCIISSYPKARKADTSVLKLGEKAKKLVSKVRETRNSKNLKPKEPLKLFVQKSEKITDFLQQIGILELVKKMAYLENFEVSTEESIENGVAFLSSDEKYFLELSIEIDVEAERDKLQKELEYQEGFVQSVSKKLSNERFVNNAPEAVVNNERKKLADGQDRIRILKESLANL